jgi:hypothetical protein
MLPAALYWRRRIVSGRSEEQLVKHMFLQGPCPRCLSINREWRHLPLGPQTLRKSLKSLRIHFAEHGAYPSIPEMILLFLLCYYVVGVASQSFPLSVRRSSFSTASNSSSSGSRTIDAELAPPSVCQQGGGRHVIVDALARSQTLEWGIGMVTSAQAPVSCRTSMSMDYDQNWQYAVTKIDWKAQVSLPASSQAILSISWAFDPNFPKLAGAVSIHMDTSSSTLADDRTVGNPILGHLRSSKCPVEQPVRYRTAIPSVVAMWENFASDL